MSQIQTHTIHMSARNLTSLSKNERCIFFVFCFFLNCKSLDINFTVLFYKLDWLYVVPQGIANVQSELSMFASFGLM